MNVENNIEMLAEQYNYQVHIAQSVIFIKTKFSRWQIVQDSKGEIKEVKHHNYRYLPINLNHKKFNYDYHSQKINVSNYSDLFLYINRHDANMLNRMKGQSL